MEISIREKKEELRQLQNKNDEKRIHEISERITQLYLSAQDISDIVSDDVVREGFRILYQKRGNNLQPQILDEGEKSKLVNYYVGSMARHTLMQLCGYLSFLYMITRGHLCPVIPFFVVDHISKPFDINNAKRTPVIIAPPRKPVNPAGPRRKPTHSGKTIAIIAGRISDFKAPSAARATHSL